MLRLAIKALLCVLLLSLSLTIVFAHGEDEETGAADAASVVTTTTQTNSPFWSVFASLGLSAVATGGSWTIARQQLTNVQLVIIALMVSTGIIHLILGLQGDILLLFNSIGYLGLVGLRFLPLLRGSKPLLLVNGAIIIYTFVTIIGYFVVHGTVETVGLITKVIEVLLILAVAFDTTQLVQQPGD